MRRKVIAIAGAALCAALFAAAPASAGTTTWRVQSVPTPLNSGPTRLFGVSCPARGSCTAVGFYDNKATGRTDTLAEYWDGTSWTIQPTPNPARSQVSRLLSASCLSGTDCTAVGTSSRGPLAEHWDGTNWTIQPVPFPAGSANAQPQAVSCASLTSCTAVGLYYEAQNIDELPLAEHWDGTNWTVQPVPLPSGAFEADLTGVSCTSATDCTAVGNYNGTTGGVPFAERWNGTTWTVQTVPDPGSAALAGVSCPSANSCTAVGGFNSGAGPQPLALRWNGTTWTVQTIPGPADAGLTSVSCPSATDCTAVGTAGHPDGSLTGVAEHWNGTSWTAQATPAPKSAATAELFGVSCRPAAYCTAVGDYNTRQPLAIHE